MGLDTVELICSIEESFEISIKGEEAVNILTVGDLYSCILNKLSTRDLNHCLSSTTFYRLRHGMMKLFFIPRADFRTTTNVLKLFPIENRRANWQKLGKTLDLKLPALTLPSWLNGAIIIIFFGLIVSSFFMHHWLAATLLFVSSLLFIKFIFRFLDNYAVHIPQNIRSVADLVESVLKLNFGKIAKLRKSWHEKEVWDTLRSIIVEQLGVKLEQVVPEARIVKDLGAD